jgi:NAD(P)-dependent dehydrogenase (short-subunit alcohol dehydrogenase family)
MTITDKTVLVTGANRGIGQALVADALRRGARRVSGGTRQPPAHPDPRVTPLTLDDLSDRAMLEEHLALAALPLTPAYSASKAAAFSLTQSLRALLAGRGVRVHAVLTGPTDTDMVRDLDIPKASPESVARAILDGVEHGEEEIFPDPMSASMAAGWRSGAAKVLERQNAALAQAQPATA